MFKLLKFLKPYWLMIIGVITFTFLNAFTQLYLPNLMGEIVDNGIIQGDISYILSHGGKMLVVALLGAISMIFASYLSSKSAMAYGRDLRQHVFTKVEGYSLDEFNRIGTSSLITRTTNDVNQMQQVTMMSLRMMVRAPLMFIGGLIMAISKNRELSHVFLVSSPILILTIAIVGKKGFPYFKIVQERIDRVNQVLREELTGIRVIRAFNRTDYEEDRFNNANRDLTKIYLKVVRLMSVMMPLLNIILNFTIVAVIWYGSKLIDMENLEIGDLMAYIQYVMQIMFSLIMVSVMFIMIPRAVASANRINEVLDMETEITDREETRDATGLRGSLEFRDVSFKYPGAENPVLCNISFTAKPGETTAIIGGTGSGKSTVISLIPRFYDVSKGAIFLDGVDIRDLSQEDLRRKIGIVSQDTMLFTGSVSDNIRFGKEDATDEEVVHAAEIAQAKEFIVDLEEGFDSNVAQGGTNLSGGQKQRLSIARALVRRPEIYVFDDSFSALDFKTDKKLRKALEEETHNSTIIIVAQRVSTIMGADSILVLDNGKIVGQGTHRELLESCKVYREIVQSQLSKEEII
ncbi:ABC transporter ATP-binding protein [Tissierellaceae bacterium HCP3S3_D8]